MSTTPAPRILVRGDLRTIADLPADKAALTATVAVSPYADEQGRHYAVTDEAIHSQQPVFAVRATGEWTCELVWATGVVYRISARGYMPDVMVYCDTLTLVDGFVAVDARDLIEPPGGATPVEWVTLTAVIAGIDAKVAAEVAEQLAALDAWSDNNVSALIGNPTTETRQALDRRFGVDINGWPGVDPTGVVECASAIQEAIDYARSVSRPVTGSGFFKIGSTVTVRDTADFSKCVFDYTATTGVAFVAGAGATRRTIATPFMVASAKTALGWSQVSGTIGVQILNTESSSITVTGAAKFETGLDVRGEGAGTSYNTIRLGELGNNKVNLRHTSDATGWANQNTFLGGRLAHDGSEGSLVAGTRHVLHPYHASFVADGNTYVGVSMESPGVVEANVESYGWYNLFIGCRWENYGPAGKVLWRGGAKGNAIVGGYEAEKLTVIADSTATGNTLTAPFVNESFWVPSASMATSVGAPVREAIGGGVPVTTLRKGYTDGIGAHVLIPDGWGRARVDVLWASQAGGTGNVVFTSNMASHVGGGSLDDWPAQVSTLGPVAAGAANAIISSTLTSSVTVTPGPAFINLTRRGADAADTLAGNVLALGLRITRLA